MKLKCLES